MIPVQRVLEKLDEYLRKGDFSAAERHLAYWAAEAAGDVRARILIGNEQMGLFRKLGREADALAAAEETLSLLRREGLAGQVGGATTLLNAATVCKAFGRTEEAIALYAEARGIYETGLSPKDPRRAGLYNNMALALVDAGEFAQAKELYRAALAVLEGQAECAPEAAVTELNLASAAEAELGLYEADAIIAGHLDRAEELLEAPVAWDGNYGYVCEKCAAVFHYYGRFFFGEELERRAERIRKA
ncbi:MAG: tetratricopeptide repeat protein [Clostridia bacterium]|nr:tetratricopeptide repeat protein [Clostridia bacterium]